MMADDQQQSLEPPDRLRRAESVLAHRTGRFCIILESALSSHNQQAVLRTAEAFGVQNVWVIEPEKHKWTTQSDDIKEVKERRKHLSKKITKNTFQWLTMRTFDSAGGCLAALRAEGWAVWATALGPEAVSLEGSQPPPALAPLPARLAVVIGQESVGVSAEMLAAADRVVYVPMFGFTESFNLSVATALVLQRLFDWCPQARGDLGPGARAALRRGWYPALLKSPTARARDLHWLEKADQVKPLKDLRRSNDDHKLWIPPKVRKREGIEVNNSNGSRSGEPSNKEAKIVGQSSSSSSQKNISIVVDKEEKKEEEENR